MTFFQEHPQLCMWGIGIILMEVYYALIAKKYGWKWYIGLLFGVFIFLLECIGAKLLFFIEGGEGVSFISGFSLFGAIFLTPLGLFVFAKLAKVDFVDLLDFYAIGFLIELGFYRFGCMLAGCCHGIAWSWGLSDGSGGYLFPVQPIEASLDLFLAVVLLALLLFKKLPKGYCFAITYIGYGIIRFALEFFRERNAVLGSLSLAHFFALAIIFFSIAYLWLVQRRNKTKKA